jgi:hypothetical protein
MRSNYKNAWQWIGRRFGRQRAAATPEYQTDYQTDYQALGHASGGLDAEYQRLVEHHLHRWGVDASCATVDIQVEKKRGRKDAFVATVCIEAWERNAVLRVLLGLPLLDKKIRQAVSALWLADVSEFRGVLLKVSPALHEPAASSELRELLVSLTGTRSSASRRRSTSVAVES